MDHLIHPATQARLNTGNLIQQKSQIGKLLPAARDHPGDRSSVRSQNLTKSTTAIPIQDRESPGLLNSQLRGTLRSRRCLEGAHHVALVTLKLTLGSSKKYTECLTV
jgi:hypothetical protein